MAKDRIIYQSRVYSWKSHKYLNHRYEFRKDPVPDVGSVFHAGYHCFRRIRTFQERKMTYAYDPCFIRAARNACNLPSSWDDVHIASRRDRSWKRCTKRRKAWDR